MISRQGLMLALILVLICPGLLPGDDPTKGPTENRFSLKMEKKLSKTTARIKLHLRIQGKRTIRFHVGKAGFSTRSLKTDPKARNLKQMTVTLELTLKAGKKPGTSIITRVIRFGGNDVASIQTDYPVPQRETLAGALTLTGSSGLYPVGMRVVLGNFLTREVTLEVNQGKADGHP